MADNKKSPTERMLTLIHRPLVTEKSTLISEGNWVAFEVAKDATKPEIKRAIETIYNVTVERVNTLTQNGKVKKFRGVMGRRKDIKKAYIRLPEGQSVDMSTGA